MTKEERLLDQESIDALLQKGEDGGEQDTPINSATPRQPAVSFYGTDEASLDRARRMRELKEEAIAEALRLRYEKAFRKPVIHKPGELGELVPYVPPAVTVSRHGLPSQTYKKGHIIPGTNGDGLRPAAFEPLDGKVRRVPDSCLYILIG